MYRFAIIGCGRISVRHAENIALTGKLVAVCDIIPERADKLAAIYGCNAYSSIEELLEHEKDLDVVSVCTPNGYHAEHSIMAMRAGMHVLCEKPLCLTSAEAWQMIETEKQCLRNLFVVKSTRYNPILTELRKRIENSSLGRIYSFHLSCIWNRPPEYYTEWRGKLFTDGGTLFTQFSHYIDAMLWLFGGIREVSGYRTNAAHGKYIEFEDTGVASILFESGIHGSVHWSVNAYRKNHEIALTVVAEKGTIRVGGEYLNEVQYQCGEIAFIPEGENSPSTDYGFYRGSRSNHDRIYRQLVAALDDKEISLANAWDGLRTVEAIELIYRSAKVISTA